MERALSEAEATKALDLLAQQSAIVEAISRTGDPDERRSQWTRYHHVQGALDQLIPHMGDTPADEGPYTSEF